MRSDIHWIEIGRPGRLAIMARPRAGDWLADEIIGWRKAGVDIVVSLLEAEEVNELGLGGEASSCVSNAIQFIAFPIPDRGVPAAVAEAASLAGLLDARLQDGKAIAIHCRAGIGRSAVIAACVLIGSGVDAVTAFDKIASARGLPVPDTEQQRRWVLDFTEKMTEVGC